MSDKLSDYEDVDCDSYTKLNFDTVEEFFSEINPYRKPNPSRIKEVGFKDYHIKSNECIYRGQGDSEWGLIPYSLRNGKGFTNSKKMIEEREPLFDVQVSFELENLRNVINLLDRKGIFIQDLSPELREDFKEMTLPKAWSKKYGRGLGDWPGKDFYGIMAISQHYGIPTRLLDWSRSPYIAAYFAASGALREKKKEEEESTFTRFAVFELDTFLFKEEGSVVEFVNIPGLISENMSAQKGVFTLYRSKAKGFIDPPEKGSKEYEKIDMLSYFSKGSDVYSKYKVSLKRITLPVTEAAKVLEILNRVYSVNAMMLFPDSKGIEMQFWDELYSIDHTYTLERH